MTVPVRTTSVLVGVLALVLTATALAGCGEERPRREWTPDDHGQSAAVEGDTSRAEATGDAAESGESAQARAATALWRVTCASCHGADGAGNGPARPPNATMSNFQDSAWQASRTDAQLAQVITKGRNLMPPFGDRINERGVAALVAHIRSFSPRSETP